MIIDLYIDMFAPSSMEVTALPQEIVDFIIDFFKDCTDDLKNCSLVSTSWTPASRRHLFRTLTLGRTYHGANLSRSPSFLQQFHQLDEILEKTPYIAEQCIRCVKLRFESYALALTRTTYHEETNSMLGKVLARLAQVEEFRLSLGNWASYPREAKHTIYAAIRQPFVSRLSILDSNFHSFSDFASLLIHSPSLKHLTVADLHFYNSALGDTSHLPTAVVHLEYLKMDTHFHCFVPAFLDSAFPIRFDHLRQLSLSLPAGHDVCELTNQLIKKTVTSPLHLELSESPYYCQGKLIKYTSRTELTSCFSFSQ